MESVSLTEGKPAAAEAGGATVMLCRVNGSVHAIGGRCSHAGGPLAEGEFDEANATIECPWHCSVFRLADGSVVHGPATSPQPAYDVRIDNGKVEVRPRTAGG
jgi:nitrite reductase/ring-hydroxylating ferredoxin subunit